MSSLVKITITKRVPAAFDQTKEAMKHNGTVSRCDFSSTLPTPMGFHRLSRHPVYISRLLLAVFSPNN